MRAKPGWLAPLQRSVRSVLAELGRMGSQPKIARLQQLDLERRTKALETRVGAMEELYASRLAGEKRELAAVHAEREAVAAMLVRQGDQVKALDGDAAEEVPLTGS